jgi:hypothetical protein
MLSEKDMDRANPTDGDRDGRLNANDLGVGRKLRFLTYAWVGTLLGFAAITWGPGLLDAALLGDAIRIKSKRTDTSAEVTRMTISDTYDGSPALITVTNARLIHGANCGALDMNGNGISNLNLLTSPGASDLLVKSTQGVYVDLDTDATTGLDQFAVRNPALSPIFQVSEDGNVTAAADVSVGDQLIFPNQNNNVMAISEWTGLVPTSGTTSVYSDPNVQIGLGSDGILYFMGSSTGWWEYTCNGIQGNTGGIEETSNVSTKYLLKSDDVSALASTWYACSFDLDAFLPASALIFLGQQSTLTGSEYTIHVSRSFGSLGGGALFHIVIDVYYN